MSEFINIRNIFLLLLLVLFVCPAYPEEKQNDSDTQGNTSIDMNAYKISNGDILEILTWKEPDFTKEVVVRSDGKISFPLLYDIQAIGHTPSELKNVIEEKLKKFVIDPIVTVSVKNPKGQFFYIIGEVVKGGAFILDRRITILQAFALAGGFTPWASTKDIILIRYEDGKDRMIKINYKDIVSGKDLKQNILINPNDTIIIP